MIHSILTFLKLKKNFVKNKRIYNAIKFLDNKNIKYMRIIDMGARDCLVRKFIPENKDYLSIDINQNSENSIDLVKDASDIDFSFVNNEDIILALDVLEHVDDIHSLLIKLIKSKAKSILICLPNTANWKFRIHYLIFGKIPGVKFNIISKSKIFDRHRWLTPIDDCYSLLNLICNETNRSINFYPVDRNFERIRNPLFLTTIRSWAGFFLIK